MRGAIQKEMFEISDLRRRDILHLRSVCPFVHQFKPNPVKCIKVGFCPSGLLSYTRLGSTGTDRVISELHYKGNFYKGVIGK